MSGGVRGRENLFDFPSYSIENVPTKKYNMRKVVTMNE